MPDPGNLTSSPAKTNNDKSDTAGASAGGISLGVKEKEQTKVQNERLGEVGERGEEADEVAEKEIKSILEDARLSVPEPKIPQDLKEAGVKSPQVEASEVIRGGTTLEIPLTEDEFRKGEHAKFLAKVTERKDVIGVSSIIAFAMWVGRLVKLAHKHTMKIVFRKGGSEGAT